MTTPEEFFAREAGQLEERLVTYVTTIKEKVVVVENVPARVNSETGEQLFSVATLQHLQQLLQGSAPPVRYVDTPVYTFAA